MTDEQTRTIEALSLRDGGFAVEREARLVGTPRGDYVVDAAGNAMEMTPTAVIGFRRLQADVYGHGATP